VVLRYWFDLSSEEAAADIGCSISTVNSHVSRGVKRLRAVLSHAHE
jgi:DNA-directed RNA polymerase specialized sigma24 family protein